jgi:hypothetical protein
MYEFARAPESAALSILFPPRAVFLLDIFRALGDFEEHYDIAALDALEGRLSALLDPAAAKSLISDALLLSFGLRREREEPLDLREVGSRRGTADESRLLAFLAASEEPALAASAAAALGLVNFRVLTGLAIQIARRLEEAGIGVSNEPRHLPGEGGQADPNGVTAGSWRAGQLAEH